MSISKKSLIEEVECLDDDKEEEEEDDEVDIDEEEEEEEDNDGGGDEDKLAIPTDSDSFNNKRTDFPSINSKYMIHSLESV